MALGDGTSHLVFDDPFKICKGLCLAVTLVGFFDESQTGTCGGLTVARITDSDTFFNNKGPFGSGWTTESEDPSGAGCSGEIYLETVVTHEVGHQIGLDHSEDPNALMAPSIGSCDNQGLTEDDEAGRDALYACAFSPCTDNDLDGFSCNDCDDDNFSVNPDASELCDDTIDNDCDGAVDCADGDCSVDPSCCISTEDPEFSCADGVDNDCDGLIDNDDPDCCVLLGQKGDPCDSDSECCSNKCKGKPANKTCK